MSQMMDKSTENPSNDTVSTKSNKSIKSDEKTSTDGVINLGMMGKFKRSLRLPTQPPSPSLSAGSASTSPKSNQKKSRPLTRSNTEPIIPKFDNTFNRLRESIRWRQKKEVDTLPSEDLKEEKEPRMPKFDKRLKRMSESFLWRWKREVDTLPSEDLKEEKYPNNTVKREFSFRQKGHEDRRSSVEVKPTFEEFLEMQAFCEATQQLIDREKHLFWETAEANKEAVEKLAADHKALAERVWQILQQSLSLSSEEASVSALTSAVKAINLEEEQDQLWRQRCRTPPAWRPKKWKEHHDKVLHELVKGRMDNQSSPTGDQMNQSSIQADIQSMGRQLKEDLQWVVEEVKNCYPPEMDICNFYARQYHQTFSARLKKIADFVLDDKDCSFLLRWVKEFYPGILEKPELANNINTEALGNLLPDELLKPLEEEYLSKQQSDLMIFIGRVLDEAKKEWDQGKEPTRDDGCYASPVAYDVIQFINGIVTSAHITVRDLHKAQKITSNLTDFMQRYQNFHEDIIKQNKPHSKAFIKANLSCVKQFRDLLVKSDLFPEDVRENCLQVLTEMKQSAHTYLLTPVHKILKPHYKKVGTSDWLKKNTFEKLLKSTEEELQELQGSSQSSYQELIGRLHQEVTEEYVQRLLKGEVKLKDSNQQQKAYEIVKENAEKLHELFAKMGSKKDWLKEILTNIAEVLKLQDIPAIQMQIVSLGSAYPDLSP
ncbi:tumor necrosis factor alpha-induced protein 2-like isoform X2 [Pelmatolapia mariae]|uniref:tumor necrosis factor alpha-induced protein 2-like isoform X2 n=1 Tax=Pelmatolapia mariae TaxID=158779 RepID=UPI002FE6326F